MALRCDFAVPVNPEKTGPYYFLLSGISIFAVRINLSSIWLNNFNYSPLEWLWRGATYKNWQLMKRYITIP